MYKIKESEMPVDVFVKKVVINMNQSLEIKEKVIGVLSKINESIKKRGYPTAEEGVTVWEIVFLLCEKEFNFIFECQIFEEFYKPYLSKMNKKQRQKLIGLANQLENSYIDLVRKEFSKMTEFFKRKSDVKVGMQNLLSNSEINKRHNLYSEFMTTVLDGYKDLLVKKNTNARKNLNSLYECKKLYEECEKNSKKFTGMKQLANSVEHLQNFRYMFKSIKEVNNLLKCWFSDKNMFENPNSLEAIVWNNAYNKENIICEMIKEYSDICNEIEIHYNGG